MLKVLRENIKYLSWILWVIIGLFVAFIFLDFGAGIGGLRGGKLGAAAKVGSHKITLAEFQRTYRRTTDQYRQALGAQFTPEMEKRLAMQVLDQLVNRQILLGEARRLGLRTSDEELRERILADPTFKDEAGRFVGDELYRSYLLQTGQTVEGFEQQMREDVVLQKVIDALRSNLWVSDKEVERAYRDQVDKAKIRYVLLPADRFAQAAADVPPGELKAYYNAHKAEMRLPEQREAAYLLVETAKLLPQVNADEAAQRRYYEEHKQEYAQDEQVRARQILTQVNDAQTDEQAKAKIEAARRRIQGGEDFAKVAREVSEDPASKASGGDLGYFGRNSQVKEFEDAAFAAEPGKLVGPIQSSLGYHLLEVTDKRPAGQRSFEEARGEIAGRLASERVREMAESRARDLAQRLQADPPKDPAALEALTKGDPTLSYALTGKIGQGDPVPGIGPSPMFNSAVFGLEKGQVSDPVQVPRGWAVAYLKDVYPPRVPAFAEVEPRLRLIVGRERAQKLATDQLARAKASGKSLEQVAQELGVQVKDSAEFGRQGIPELGMSPELTRAVFALNPGQTGGPVPAGPGAVLFQVTERKQGSPQEFAAQRQATRERLEQDQLQQVLASLIERRRKELNVQYDRDLLKSLGLAGEEAQS
jgi:peptidyl-prolyl cis-trans isomerase D